jgi:uncharacterized membrane protein
MTSELIINIVLLIIAVPVGLLIAYLCRDELVEGRKWFRIIVLMGIILGIWFYIRGQTYISLTLFFIAIAALVSHIKSYDKKWTKKKI